MPSQAKTALVWIAVVTVVSFVVLESGTTSLGAALVSAAIFLGIGYVVLMWWLGQTIVRFWRREYRASTVALFTGAAIIVAMVLVHQVVTILH